MYLMCWIEIISGSLYNHGDDDDDVNEDVVLDDDDDDNK